MLRRAQSSNIRTAPGASPCPTGRFTQNTAPPATGFTSGHRGRERLETLELEVGQIRRELVEAQERLDFTERMLAQGREARQLDVDR